MTVLALFIGSTAWASDCYTFADYQAETGQNIGNCSGCVTPLGSPAKEYRFHNGTGAPYSSWFGSNKNRVRNGIKTWNSSSSTVHRGSSFDTVEGPTSSMGPGVNGESQLFYVNASWWNGIPGIPNGAIAATQIAVDIPTCSTNEFDMYFKGGVYWVGGAPGNISPSPLNGKSLRWTAAHEFGHAMGLVHELNKHSMMGGVHPDGGEHGTGEMILHEDEADFMKTTYPDSTSTGMNAALNRFDSVTLTGASIRTSWETWTDQNSLAPVASDRGFDHLWCAGDVVTDPSLKFPPVHLSFTGTQTTNLLVHWKLMTGTSSECSSTGHTYLIGAYGPAPQNGTASYQDPFYYKIPNGTPPGDYTLCAVVDPNSEISETSESDNAIYSEIEVTVADPSSFACSN